MDKFCFGRCLNHPRRQKLRVIRSCVLQMADIITDIIVFYSWFDFFSSGLHVPINFNCEQNTARFKIRQRWWFWLGLCSIFISSFCGGILFAATQNERDRGNVWLPCACLTGLFDFQPIFHIHDIWQHVEYSYEFDREYVRVCQKKILLSPFCCQFWVFFNFHGELKMFHASFDLERSAYSNDMHFMSIRQRFRGTPIFQSLSMIVLYADSIATVLWNALNPCLHPHYNCTF